MSFRKRIFNLIGDEAFDLVCLDIFRYQYRENEIYRNFVDSIGVDPANITQTVQIPFLPVSFFRTHKVITGQSHPEKIFVSSGTSTSSVTEARARHHVTDLSIYDESLVRSFEIFHRPLNSYIIFALTPTPEQNPDSSLIYMISKWISASGSELSDFYLNRMELMAERLEQCYRSHSRILIIGLSYALLDFAEQFPMDISRVLMMETGGMKGKRPEMVKEELHRYLAQHFHFEPGDIHSEYGMTELLSQAYSKGEGKFRTPPWMKVLIRDVNDPLTLLNNGSSGGINIIDLANFNSCSFLAIQDLGKLNVDGTFEVLGRFDNSDLRGCNLLMD